MLDQSLTEGRRITDDVHLVLFKLGGKGLAETNRPRRVILCRTASEAQQALRLVEDWTRQNGLTLHPTKTQVVDVNETGFDFLGYHFLGTRHWVSEKAVRTVKAKTRQLTPRKSGVSLTVTITRLNSMLRGWLNYFQHSRPWVFPRLDTFIRQGLRSIERRRSKRKGCAKRHGQSSVAKHVLCRTRAAESGRRPCHGLSILSQVTPSTGEPCAGDPHARFGGKGA